MAAPEIKVDYEALASVANLCDEHSSATTNALQAIRSQLDVLQGGAWVGPAATTFYQAANSDFIPGLERMIAAINALNEAMAQSINTYASAEEDASNACNGW